ncbi:hypothetical protein M8C21_018379, partial [Ambrosia artemisiifolia]
SPSHKSSSDLETFGVTEDLQGFVRGLKVRLDDLQVVVLVSNLVRTMDIDLMSHRFLEGRHEGRSGRPRSVRPGRWLDLYSATLYVGIDAINRGCF